MTRLPMDSSEDNPTWTLESLKTSIDDASQAMQVATQLSEMLATNLSNLTLNPSIKLPYLPEYPSQLTGQLPSEKTPHRRRGVRTVLSERRYRMQKLIESLRLRYAKGIPRVSSG